MAQGKARSGERSHPAKGPAKVNLYCKDCNSQLGIFNNEWIHLTPSYAGPKEKGKNFGTRIGDNTKKVPEGVHKMAAGCDMAEIFCESCNLHLGQHCEQAPTSKKSQMVGKYFYKLSKTYLKDAKTAKAVENVFVDGEDFTPSTPEQRPITAKVSTSGARHKSTPEQPARENQREGSSRTPSAKNNSEEQNVLVSRLADLERLVRNGGFAAPPNPTRPEAYGPAPQHYPYPYTAPAASSQHEQVIEDQRKQITSLTTQVDSLRGTIEDLREIIKDLRAEKSRQETVSLQESTVLNRFDEMIRSVRDGQSRTAEADKLRADNERLRERLSLMAGANGVPSDASEDEIRANSTLGKRKRAEEHTRRASYRNNDAYGQQGGPTGPSNDQHHLPSPDSLQDHMNGRGPTPAMPPPPRGNAYTQHQQPQYAPPTLRHQFSEPSLSRYSTPGFHYNTVHPSENMYPNPVDRVARQEGMYAPPSDSRPGRRAASTNAARRLRSRRSDADRAVGDSVDFSDDEIATPAPGDAPLSVPRKRPAPPMFASEDHRPPSRLGSTFPEPAFDDSYVGYGVLKPSIPYWQKPPPTPKQSKCTSLRQAAWAPGLDNALMFTPEEVAKRMEKEKRTSRPRARKADSRSSGDAEKENTTPLPVDPALEQLVSRDDPMIEDSDKEGSNEDDDNEFQQSRPTRGTNSTRSSTRKTTK